MLILLDCRPLQYAGPGSERSRYIFSVVATLSKERSVEWLFVADHTFRPGLFPDLPAVTLTTRRALSGSIGWKLWYDWQIPRLAKQHGADLVMLTAGISAGTIRQPQCLWMPERVDTGDRHLSRLYPPVFRSRLMKSLQVAASIFCFSEGDRVWLTGSYPSGGEKVFVLPPVAGGTRILLSPEEREGIKEKYVQGKEYFHADITGAGEKEVMNLLRAFSMFKKRQQSNLQLMLTGEVSGPAGEIRERLQTYKYRDAVHLRDGPSEEENVLLASAAYAAIFPFERQGFGTNALDAWKAGVPVIAGGGSLAEEVAGEAVLMTVAGDPASLAGRMMQIYKDENLRGDLIRRGFARLEIFSRGRPSDKVWEGVQQAMR